MIAFQNSARQSQKTWRRSPYRQKKIPQEDTTKKHHKKTYKILPQRRSSQRKTSKQRRIGDCYRERYQEKDTTDESIINNDVATNRRVEDHCIRRYRVKETTEKDAYRRSLEKKTPRKRQKKMCAQEKMSLEYNYNNITKYEGVNEGGDRCRDRCNVQGEK